MKLTALPGASLRTNNRLEEHTDWIATDIRPAACFNGAVGLFACCTCHGEPWIGWLPLDEIQESDG
jgi:hypothetical protein